MWKVTFCRRLPQITVIAAALIFSNGFAFEFSLSDTWCGVSGAARIACDTTNHLVYVTSPLDSEIVVFDSGGNIVNTIATPGPAGAICLAESGHVIVSVGRAVYKMNMSGTIVTTYGDVAEYFMDPHDVVWVPDGRVYVSDDDDRIRVFNAAGERLFTFGQYGYFNGRFDEPVAFTYNGVTEELVVTDQNNYRIQAFTLEGDSLRKWGMEGNGLYTNGAFFRPFGIDVDGGGQIWLLDMLTDLIQVYDEAGAYLNSAPLNEFGMRGGVDIAVDGSTLYVTSPSTNCVYVFNIIGSVIPNVFPPYQLTIMWTETGLQLNWVPQSGAVGYYVERSTDVDFAEASIEMLGFTADTTFTDLWQLNSHDACYYRVIADLGLVGRTSSADYRFGPDYEYGSDRFRDALDTPHDSPHHVTHGVNCNSCHLRPYIYPSPRPAWWFGDHLCKSCHVETGFAVGVETHLGQDTIACRVCHSPHYQQPQFPRYLIRNANPMGESNNMWFNHETDYIHGAPLYDGICEICHTQTDYYRRDGSGAEHHLGSDCSECHTHQNGFMPVTAPSAAYRQ